MTLKPLSCVCKGFVTLHVLYSAAMGLFLVILYLSKQKKKSWLQLETHWFTFQNAASASCRLCSLCSSLLMIDRQTAGWPTLERVSRRRRLPLRGCRRQRSPWIWSLISDKWFRRPWYDGYIIAFALADFPNRFSFNVCVVSFSINRPRTRENTCQSDLGRGTSRLFNVRRKHNLCPAFHTNPEGIHDSRVK